MRTSALLLGAATALSATAAVQADIVDSVADALAACTECLQTGGDGDCSDECDVIGNADDAVNKCCDWWSCKSCDDEETNPTPATTTRPVKKSTTTTKPRRKTTTAETTTTRREPRTTVTDSPPPRTTTADRTTTTAPTITTRRESRTTTTRTEEHRTTTRTKAQEHRTTSAATGASESSPLVATVYSGAACGGTALALSEADFAGGISDALWDSCSDAAGNRQLQSLLVAPGYTVAVSDQCNDQVAWKDNSDWDDVEVAAVATADSGCVSTEFVAVDYDAPVARVFEDSDCGGRSVLLTVSDFVGGKGDAAWDACNAEWENGSPIEYQSSDGTWLKSMLVFSGFTVTTATQCNDDYAYPAINYKDVVSVADGCVSMDYDFNHVDYSVAGDAFATRTTTVAAK